MMVRSDYMPNPDWRAICERGRALREAAGTLAGHAVGAASVPVARPGHRGPALGPSRRRRRHHGLAICRSRWRRWSSTSATDLETAAVRAHRRTGRGARGGADRVRAGDGRAWAAPPTGPDHERGGAQSGRSAATSPPTSGPRSSKPCAAVTSPMTISSEPVTAPGGTRHSSAQPVTHP